MAQSPDSSTCKDANTNRYGLFFNIKISLMKIDSLVRIRSSKPEHSTWYMLQIPREVLTTHTLTSFLDGVGSYLEGGRSA